MSNKGRGVATAVVLVLWATVNWLLNVAAPIVSSELAAKQFDNSNVSYGVSRFAQFFTGAGLPTLILLVVLVAVWWKPLKSAWASLLAAVMLIMVMAPHVAQAYYEKDDWPEIHFILPNESAFFTPDVGANKDSQAKFGSEQYLRENKIAAKRFQIPHTKLSGSSYLRDFYVPAGRLIIVDRTPYHREWVFGKDRGTSEKNEAFPCQSKEGLDITVGVAIGTSVLEENAPRFLYWFGVKPPDGDRTKPEVVFTSVFHAQSHREVMDGVVRNMVQSLVCEQFTTRSFEDANSQATDIMTAIRKNTKEYLDSVGITLNFIGWADTFTFDPTVQKAINDKYAAEKVAPVLPVLQALADIRVKEGLGIGLSKRLPSTLMAPPDTIGGIMGVGLLKPMKATPTPPVQ